MMTRLWSLRVAILVSLALGFNGSAQGQAKPDLYILSVGIDKYKAPTNNLNGCVNDAQGMAKVLKSQEGKKFAKVEAAILTDAQATKAGITGALETLEKKGRAGDWHVLVLSGHGGITNDKWGFLTQDNGDISDQTLLGLADRLAGAGRKVVVIIDACHAGVLRFAAGPVLNRHNDPAKGGIILMVSSMPDQFSIALGNYSAFARAVEDGLRGLADYDDDEVVTLKELRRYTYNRVYELSLEKRQFPGTTVSYQDSAIDASLSVPETIGLVQAKRLDRKPRDPEGPEAKTSPLRGQTWMVTMPGTANSPPINFELKLDRLGAYRVTLKEGTRATKIGTGTFKITEKTVLLMHHQGTDRLEVVSATPSEFQFKFQDKAYTLRTDSHVGDAVALDVSGRLLPEDAKDRVRKDSPHKTYKLKLDAGSTYVMDLQSADFDSYLRVEDDNGVQVAEDDDGGGDRNARVRYTPTRSGDFTIIATTYRGGSGTFNLRVGKITGPRTVNTSPATLQTHLNVSERLTDADPKDRLRTDSFAKEYKVDLKAGVQYTIDLVSQDFDTYLRLEDKNGMQVAFDDDSGEGLNARIIYTPATDGTYRVFATAYKQATGRFTLTVRSPSISPVTGGGTPVELKDGAALVNDRLTDKDGFDSSRKSSYRKVFLVKLEKGTGYTVFMKSTDVDSYLRIEDATGKELARDDDGGGERNARILFSPPENGVYRIVTTTFHDRTTGAFSLSIDQTRR